MLGWFRADAASAFALETGQRLGVSRNFRRQKLQGDKATERRVLSLVHNAHSTAAQFLDDAVVRDGLADHPQACYGGSVGKSIKAVGFVVFLKP